MAYDKGAVKEFGVLGPTVSTANKQKLFSFTPLRKKIIYSFILVRFYSHSGF